MSKQIDQPEKSSVQKKSSFSQKIKTIWSQKAFVIIIITLQVIIVLWIINPLKIYQNFQNQQVLNEVASITQIDKTKTPVIAQISDINSLKNENAIQAQVYKDAKNGDYVLGYSDKLIIYRRDSKVIIYNGDTPDNVLEKNQQDVINNIVSKAKELNLISIDSTETPQVSTLSNIEQLKTQNNSFYANATSKDVVAVFPNSQIIILYNIESKSIINKGRFITSINPL